MMDSLVSSGLDVNRLDDYGWTPLCHAAERGNTKVIRMLLASGADVNMPSHIGFTPLTCAVRAKQRKAAEVLRQAGAKHEETNALIDRLNELNPDMHLDMSWFLSL